MFSFILGECSSLLPQGRRGTVSLCTVQGKEFLGHGNLHMTVAMWAPRFGWGVSSKLGIILANEWSFVVGDLSPRRRVVKVLIVVGIVGLGQAERLDLGLGVVCFGLMRWINKKSSYIRRWWKEEKGNHLWPPQGDGTVKVCVLSIGQGEYSFSWQPQLTKKMFGLVWVSTVCSIHFLDGWTCFIHIGWLAVLGVLGSFVCRLVWVSVHDHDTKSLI